MVNFYLMLLFFFLFSCGKKIEEKDPRRREEEDSGDGIYTAVLYAVNPLLSSGITGQVKVSRYGDDLRVSSNVRNGPQLDLKQGLHTGADCPTRNLDTDRDGKVSFPEVLPVTGYIILPLDGDLSSQLRGQELRFGTHYRYERSTSYSLMLSDLHLPDEIINDELVKLPFGELGLEKKVVTIYATLNDVIFPVACGVLTKVSNIPEDDSWDSPLPGENTGSRRPRRRPPARPPPEPPTEVKPPPETPPPSWWERVRDRWRRWRDRWRSYPHSHDL